MKQYTLSEDKLKELIYWSHSYGRSMQFNYGLFGPDCNHAKPFSEDKAAEYCMDDIEKLSISGEANARLIAAAPDLLEVACDILENISAGRIDADNGIVKDSWTWHKLTAAIQKATK